MSRFLITEVGRDAEIDKVVLRRSDSPGQNRCILRFWSVPGAVVSVWMEPFGVHCRCVHHDVRRSDVSNFRHVSEKNKGCFTPTHRCATWCVCMKSRPYQKKKLVNTSFGANKRKGAYLEQLVNKSHEFAYCTKLGIVPSAKKRHDDEYKVITSRIGKGIQDRDTMVCRI